MNYLDMMMPVLFFLGISSVIGARLFRNQSSTLVLQKFSLAVTSQAVPQPTVEIVGRMHGIVAFVLTLMGFSPITRFTIAGPEIRCQSSSLFGQRSQFIPLRCVTTMAAGVHKPISMLIWALVVVVMGSYMSYGAGSWLYFAVAQMLGIVFVVMYFITKKFFIEIYAQGGPPISLLFKPNVLEGVPIDVEQALEVVDVIRDLILQDGTGGSTTHDSVLGDVDEEPRGHGTSWESADDEPEDDEPEDDDERQAKHWYAQARQYAQAGQARLAIATLRQLIRRFPNTAAAEQARRSLEKSGPGN